MKARLGLQVGNIPVNLLAKLGESLGGAGRRAPRPPYLLVAPREGAVNGPLGIL